MCRFPDPFLRATSPFASSAPMRPSAMHARLLAATHRLKQCGVRRSRRQQVSDFGMLDKFVLHHTHAHRFCLWFPLRLERRTREPSGEKRSDSGPLPFRGLVREAIASKRATSARSISGPKGGAGGEGGQREERPSVVERSRRSSAEAEADLWGGRRRGRRRGYRCCRGLRRCCWRRRWSAADDQVDRVAGFRGCARRWIG